MSIFRNAIFVVVFLFLLLSVTYQANALTIESANGSKEVTILNDTDDDLLVKGENYVSIEGDVNGDLIVIGEKITISGTVEGNVYAFGSEITVENIVGKSLYVAGGTTRLDGEVLRDVYVAGGYVIINGSVGEDVIVMAGDVILDGEVGDDVRLVTGQSKITNTINGDVLSSSGSTTISGTVGGSVITQGDADLRGSSVTGDFIAYKGANDVVSYSGSIIQGERSFKNYQDIFEFQKWDNASLAGSFISDLWARAIWSTFQCLGIVMVGYLLFKFAPVRLETTLANMNNAQDALKSFLVGFVAFPVGVMIALLLAFSVFGWPLLRVLILLALLATSTVTPIAGIMLGRKILPVFGSKRKYVVPLTLGVVIINILKLIPILGWLFYQSLVFIVVGAILRTQWNKYKIAQNLRFNINK